MHDIDPLLRFLASDPALIKNLRARHVADRFDSCQGCPSGTAITACQYLRWANQAEGDRAPRRADR